MSPCHPSVPAACHRHPHAAASPCRLRRLLVLRCAPVLLVLAGSAAEAATYVVGSGTGCSHSSVQAAITTAQATPGAHVIRITRSSTWTAQALVINTSQTLDLEGGYASCDQVGADGLHTVLDGQGGSAAPVLLIETGAGGLVRLRRITVQRGDVAGTGHGGGIFFRGSGRLELHDSALINNIAGYGGGIYAEGLGADAELRFGADVIVSANTARYSGGGVYIDGMRLTMVDPRSSISFNEALGTADSGYGGGLIVLARHGRPASAMIGSSGTGNLGTIFGNVARYGGGIAVYVADDSGDDALATVFGTDPAQRTRIRDNFASVVGGAVYARPFYREAPTLRIGHAGVRFFNSDVLDNVAPTGAVGWLETDTALFGAVAIGSSISFNRVDPPSGSAPCPEHVPCVTIAGNLTANATGNPTAGAVFALRRESVLSFGRSFGSNPAPDRGGALITGNQAGRLVDADDDSFVGLANAAIVDNDFSIQLVRTDDDSDVRVVDVTLAGNTLGANPVLQVSGNVTVRRSILWQPGRTLLAHSGGVREVEWSIASEAASLGGGPGAIVAPPRFVDPAGGNYRLRAASPAIDYTGAVAGDDRDVDGRPRDQRIEAVPRDTGLVRDIGAYERQTLQPLVLNGEFDTALGLWSPTMPGAATWDGTQNAPGSTGGSAAVNVGNLSEVRFTALVQCIHLPGPGRYLLNGSGRSGFGVIGMRDTVLLHWQYRRNGSEACNAGPPDASDDHVLTTLNSWNRPAQAAVIDVPESEWSHVSSITIALVVIDNGLTTPGTATGWFDRVTLEHTTIGDDRPPQVFRDGFESP
jgi:hypothetical protein